VEGIKTGETYTLKETVAPDGYAVTTETTFTLKEDGTIDKEKTTTKVSDEGVLLIEDDKTKVTISTVETGAGEELEGAEIELVDSKGNVVEKWTSGTDGKDENGKLKPHVVERIKTGETYTLKETVAPDGYAITTDTTVVLKEDGTIDTEKTTTKVSDEGVLLVEDDMTEVRISKVETGAGEELEGAHIVLKDSEGNIVEEWDSTKEAHIVKGLKTGEVYTLSETVAPDGYAITTDTTFVLKEDGTIDKDKTTTKVSDEGVLLIEDDKLGETTTETTTVVTTKETTTVATTKEATTVTTTEGKTIVTTAAILGLTSTTWKVVIGALGAAVIAMLVALLGFFRKKKDDDNRN